MSSENGQQTATALKWLYEMEVVNNPVLQANLYENVFFSHKGIKDCAVWIVPTYTHQKGILVWVSLTTWTKWFHKEEALATVKNVIKELLPSYGVRVVEDKKILDLAQEKIKEIYGEPSEKANPISNPIINDDSIQTSKSEGIQEEGSSDISSNPEESSKD